MTEQDDWATIHLSYDLLASLVEEKRGLTVKLGYFTVDPEPEPEPEEVTADAEQQLSP